MLGVIVSVTKMNGELKLENVIEVRNYFLDKEQHCVVKIICS